MDVTGTQKCSTPGIDNLVSLVCFELVAGHIGVVLSAYDTLTDDAAEDLGIVSVESQTFLSVCNCPANKLSSFLED